MLSILTTLYRSEAALGEFIARTVAAAEKTREPYEILLVNDGSPDASLAKALELRAVNPRITVIDLSRNFGQHRALLAGLAEARGDQIFWIESDLEEEPEWLLPFRDALSLNPEADVVFGVQRSRKGALMERLSGQLFYSLFNLLSEVRMPENHVTCRLMTRRYAQALLSFGEREIFLGGLYEAAGFRQVGVPVRKHSHSPTTYSFSRKLQLVLDSVGAFSSFPITLIFCTGLLFATLAALVFFTALARALAVGSVESLPFTALLASLWFLGGLLLAAVGTVGFYVRKTLLESKGRPRAVVRHVYRSP